MREIKIFVIVAVIIGVIYYGVEPLAHHAMHPDTAASDYEFKDLEKFGKFDFANANADNGKELFANNCASCHNVAVEKSKDFNMANPKAVFPAEKGGVIPPDLSNIGGILHPQFLAHFIKDPVRATLLDAKFQVSCEGLDGEVAQTCEARNEGKASYPMTAFNGLLSDAEIVDIVAYLQKIAPKSMSDKEVFMEACNRCHGIYYDKGQYDSKLFANHNGEVQKLIDRVEKDGADSVFASLSDDEKNFVDSLLATQKIHDKMNFSEEELDKEDGPNAAISVKMITTNPEDKDNYQFDALLKSSLRISDFKGGVAALTNGELIRDYLGNVPPDLSMMIREKGAHELAAFINNPRKVAYIDIQKAILNKLAKDEQDKEIAALPADLDDEAKKAKIDDIRSQGYEFYGIKLPENTTKSQWQDSRDYTNMAYDMGVMPPGKAMPRVGLTKEAEEQVVSYLSAIGDSKKEQRESLGKWIIGFFILLAALAYLWKGKIWRELH